MLDDYSLIIDHVDADVRPTILASTLLHLSSHMNQPDITRLGSGVAAEVHGLAGGALSDDLRQQQPELSTMYRNLARV